MELLDVGIRIADGESIDWSSDALIPSDAPTLRVLQQLQALERIAALHGSSLPPANARLLPSLALGDEPEAEENQSPVRWGRLDIIRKVGQGTFGDVYLAKDRSLDRQVALKLLRHRERDVDASQDVIEEGRLLARVRHPNIVAVYGAERVDGRVGVWTEFVDGVTLADELRAHGPLAPLEVGSVGAALCAALQVVHDAGLLHRDIKAQNVMRSASGRILLTDFGAGLLVDEDRPSVLAGTPIYLAPEVLGGEPATRASDIYALGVLLHFLASGTYPVNGRSLRDLRDAHEFGRRQSIALIQPSLPRGLASAIERATDPEPSRRFSTAKALEDALRHAVPSPRAAKWRWPAAIAASFIVAAAAWSITSMFDRRRQDTEVPAPTASSSPASTATPAGATSMIPAETPVATPADAPAATALTPTGLSTQQFWPEWQATSAASAISPDGAWVLCTIRGRGQLARCPIDGSAPTPIGSIQSRTYPLLSPDGRQVAYIRYDPQARFQIQSTGELHIASVDGSADQLVLIRNPDERIMSLDGWSRDGTTIAVKLTVPPGLPAAPEEIELVSPATLKVVAAARLPAGGFYRLSNDGRSLVFTRLGDIWTFDVYSGDLKPVVTDPANDTRPFWSANGTSILFTSDRAATRGLWRVALRDGKPTGPAELVRDLGRAIAWPYGFTRSGRLLIGLDSGGFDSYIAEVDAASATVVRPPARIARSPLDANATPDWSPDGHLLAFVSDGGGRGTVTVQRDSGDVLLQFPIDHTYYQTRLRWLSDGRSALLGLGRNLTRYDLTTGQSLDSVVLDRERAADADVDGALRRIVYKDQGQKRGEIVVRDVVNGHERVVVPASIMAGRQVLSFSLDPEGARLAFVQRQADGTHSLQLAENGGQGMTTVMRSHHRIVLGPWTRDGRYLFLSRQLDPATDRSEIVVLEVATGTARALPIVMPQIWQIRLHPDGRRLAFVTGPSGQELALLSGSVIR